MVGSLTDSYLCLVVMTCARPAGEATGRRACSDLSDDVLTDTSQSPAAGTAEDTCIR